MTTLIVNKNPYYPTIIDVDSDDLIFNVTISGSVVNIRDETHYVNVWMVTGSVCNIKWGGLGITAGIGFDYPSSQTWIAADYNHNADDQQNTNGVQRYGLVSTLNVASITGTSIPAGMTVLSSNSKYLFGAYGAGTERFNFTTGDDHLLATNHIYTSLYVLNDDEFIGEYTTSGSAGVAFDHVYFDTDAGTLITNYMYPAGLLHTSPKVYTDRNTVVWWTAHWDGSYPTQIYSHSFNLRTKSFAHNVIYTFTDAANYFASGVAPGIYSNRCHPSVIEDRTFFFPTFLPGGLANNYRISIIIMIDGDGTGTTVVTTAQNSLDPTLPISIQGAAADINANLIYFFNKDWDNTDYRYKMSSISKGGTITHVKEWDKYEEPVPDYPCVYMVGTRNAAYRIQNNGMVYKASTNAYIGALGQLQLYPHWLAPSGTVYPVYYNGDDVYDRIYFNDTTKGGGYLNCLTGVLVRDSNMASGYFLGNRIIENTGLKRVLHTRIENMTAEQTAFINAINST